MNTALPPDADFVDIEYVPAGLRTGDPLNVRQMRQYWFVRYAPTKSSAPEATAPAASVAQAAVADVAAPAPPAAATTPAPHFSLDLARESTARSSAILFEGGWQEPHAAAPAAAPAAAQPQSASMRNLGLASVLGLDTAADAVREARQLIFDRIRCAMPSAPTSVTGSRAFRAAPRQARLPTSPAEPRSRSECRGTRPFAPARWTSAAGRMGTFTSAPSTSRMPMASCRSSSGSPGRCRRMG